MCDAPDHGSTKVGGREVRRSKRPQGRDFTPERLSAHVVGSCPPLRTSRVVQWTGAMPLTMDQPKVGVNRGQQCRFSAAAVHAISSSATAQAQPDAAHSSRATYHLIPSGAAAQAHPTAACNRPMYHSLSSGAVAQAQPPKECTGQVSWVLVGNVPWVLVERISADPAHCSV